VVQIQERSQRGDDEPVEEEPSAHNTSTNTKKNTPCQTNEVGDLGIKEREYDRKTEIANSDEQDKFDHEQLRFNDIEANLRSSPPYSPPKVTLLLFPISNPRSQSSNASKQL